MISRRMFSGIVGAIPFAEKMLPSALESSLPMLGESGQILGKGQLYEKDECDTKESSPKLSRQEAIKLAVRIQPEFLEHFRSMLYEREREITRLDPDLEVLRSFSPMAKITFQRQRNVERAMERELSTKVSIRHMINEIIDKLRDKK